jgi:hypothetical protein
MFGVVPSRLSIAGILITLVSVALVAWRKQPRKPTPLPSSPFEDDSRQNRTAQTLSRTRST